MVMQPMLVERGINFFNADGTECLFNRPEVADAMRHLKRRFDEGVTDRALSTTEDVMSALGTGDNSMGFCTVGWINSWETAYPQTKGQLMLIPNPAWPGTTPMHAASTWAYSVNVQNRDTEKAWAWKLIDYMTGDPESAMKEINTLLPRTGWEKTEWAKQIKNVDMMALASQSSFPSGSTIHWPELQIPVQRAMQRILFENADIQTELDRATAEVNEAIRNKR
jgi:ABC-type glycerol-3-phosphate transport system substrate-binding protein